MKARAIVFADVNKVEIRTVELPEPKADELLLEAMYTCISPGTELRCLSGKQINASFPMVPGYAMVGTVIKSGAQAHVAEGSIGFIGGSSYAPGINVTWGGHMSHAVRAASQFLPVPDGVDLVQASAVKMAAIPYHGVRICHPRSEERIALIGLGAIGHMAAKLYTNSGAHVVATDMSAKRVSQANAAGVKAVVAGASLVETFKPFFPDGADVVVDCTGVPKVLAQAILVARGKPWDDGLTPGARFVIQGSYADTFTVPYDDAFMREMQFIIPRDVQSRDIRIILDMVGRKALSLSSIISHVRKPEEAQKTYDQLRDPNTDLMTVVHSWK